MIKDKIGSLYRLSYTNSQNNIDHKNSNIFIYDNSILEQRHANIYTAKTLGKLILNLDVFLLMEKHKFVHDRRFYIPKILTPNGSVGYLFLMDEIYFLERVAE